MLEYTEYLSFHNIIGINQVTILKVLLWPHIAFSKSGSMSSNLDSSLQENHEYFDLRASDTFLLEVILF
jgi:hypothetical protein